MDASHILVGALTAITFILLIWIEVRSRRNTAAELEPQEPMEETVVEAQPRTKKRRRGRRRLRSDDAHA